MLEKFPAAVGVTTRLCTATEPTLISRRFPRPRLSQPFLSVCHCGAVLPFFSSFFLTLFTVRPPSCPIWNRSLTCFKVFKPGSKKATSLDSSSASIWRPFRPFFLLPFSVFLISLPVPFTSISSSFLLSFSSLLSSSFALFYLPLSLLSFSFAPFYLLLSLLSFSFPPFYLPLSFPPPPLFPFLVFIPARFAPARLIEVGAR